MSLIGKMKPDEDQLGAFDQVLSSFPFISTERDTGFSEEAKESFKTTERSSFADALGERMEDGEN